MSKAQVWFVLLAISLALAEASAESQPPSVQLVLEGISRISWMFETPEEEWVNTKSMGEVGHEGDDYYADDWARKDGNTRGQIVYAGISGRAIVLPFDPDGYGNHVVIYDSASKFALRYAHLDEILVSDGQDVTVGLTSIGKVGSTGFATGPHLHIVLYKNVPDENSRAITWAHVPIGKPIDPPTEFAAPFLYNPKIEIEGETRVFPSANMRSGIVFERTYGGADSDGISPWGFLHGGGRLVHQISDGGYIISGCSWSFDAGAGTVCLIRTDADGVALWTRTYGGWFGNSVQQTSDGGYIIAGVTSHLAPGEVDYGVCLIKTDADGIALWERTYGGADTDWGLSVQQTLDGGYIIAGYTVPFGADKADAYLIKTDADGVILWERTYGGADADWGSSVQQTLDGGYITAGSTKSFGAGEHDVYLIKTNADGAAIWERTYGGAGVDWGSSVQQTSDGGYVIVGSTSLGEGGAYLIKTDTDGIALWTRTYSRGPGFSVRQTLDGGYVIAGYTWSFAAEEAGEQDQDVDVYLIKTNADGIALWERTYGGPDEDVGFSVEQTSDGGYIIAGETESFGAGGTDFYLIKTDAEGYSKIVVKVEPKEQIVKKPLQETKVTIKVKNIRDLAGFQLDFVTLESRSSCSPTF